MYNSRKHQFWNNFLFTDEHSYYSCQKWVHQFIVLFISFIFSQRIQQSQQIPMVTYIMNHKSLCSYHFAERCILILTFLQESKTMFFQHPDLETFVTDMQELCAFIADGPLKSFCFQRLSYLQSKYETVEVIHMIEKTWKSFGQVPIWVLQWGDIDCWGSKEALKLIYKIAVWK